MEQRRFVVCAYTYDGKKGYEEPIQLVYYDKVNKKLLNIDDIDKIREKENNSLFGKERLVVKRNKVLESVYGDVYPIVSKCKDIIKECNGTFERHKIVYDKYVIVEHYIDNNGKAVFIGVKQWTKNTRFRYMSLEEVLDGLLMEEVIVKYCDFNNEQYLVTGSTKYVITKEDLKQSKERIKRLNSDIERFKRKQSLIGTEKFQILDYGRLKSINLVAEDKVITLPSVVKEIDWEIIINTKNSKDTVLKIKDTNVRINKIDKDWMVMAVNTNKQDTWKKIVCSSKSFIDDLLRCENAIEYIWNSIQIYKGRGIKVHTNRLRMIEANLRLSAEDCIQLYKWFARVECKSVNRAELELKLKETITKELELIRKNIMEELENTKAVSVNCKKDEKELRLLSRNNACEIDEAVKALIGFVSYEAIKNKNGLPVKVESELSFNGSYNIRPVKVNYLIRKLEKLRIWVYTVVCDFRLESSKYSSLIANSKQEILRGCAEFIKNSVIKVLEYGHYAYIDTAYFIGRWVRVEDAKGRVYWVIWRYCPNPFKYKENKPKEFISIKTSYVGGYTKIVDIEETMTDAEYKEYVKEHLIQVKDNN